MQRTFSHRPIQSALALAVLLLLVSPLRAQDLALDQGASDLTPDIRLGSVAWGDYTGDGLDDLIVVGTNGSNNLVSEVYRADGSGGLVLDQAASDLIPGANDSAVAWGDYTGDGFDDLILIGGDAGFVPFTRVYRADGMGGLVLDLAATDLIPDVRGSVAWGDYTGDGLDDLVVVGFNFTTNTRYGLVYRADGAGGLVLDQAASDLVPDVTDAVAWGDYTGDGLADLVVTGFILDEDFNRVDIGEVYRADGTGGLVLDQAASAVVADLDNSSVAWGDYSGDGLADLIVTGTGPNGPFTPFTEVYRTDGAGGLVVDQAATALVPDISNGSVAWSDYTGDGLADLVVTGSDNSTFSRAGRVYRADGSGGFVLDQAASDLVPDVRFAAAAWGDYTGDGLADLVITGEDRSGNLIGEVYRSTGGPSGPPVDLVATATSSTTVAPGGSVSFAYAITNTTTNPITGDFWYAVAGTGIVARITSGTLPAGQTVTGTYTQQVPSNAPERTYSYALRLGLFPNTVVDEEVFAITVDNGATRGTESLVETWSVRGAAPWAVQQAEVMASTMASAGLGVYPNPFADRTTVAFDVQETTTLQVVVYDVLGRAVATLIDGEVAVGRHEASLPAKDLPTGIYLVRLTTESGVTATQQVTLVR